MCVSLFMLKLACADLSEELVGGISAEQYYSNVDGFKDLTVAMYEPLFKYYGRENGSIITETGTDIFKYGSGAREFMNHYNSALNPSSTGRGFRNIWIYFYRGINLANSVIDRADDAEGITEEEKTRWIAEARFLRAHYYHILVLQFGDVHLTLEETIGVETESNRTSEDEVWAVIKEDLEFAIDNLPEEQSDIGRATANAARHNLAYVHLIRENWQEAADFAIEIIDSGLHELLDNYADVWDPYNSPGFPGPWHEEVIWGRPKNQDVRRASNFQESRNFGPRVRTLAGVQQVRPRRGQTTSRYKVTRFALEEIFGNDPNNDSVNMWNDTRYHSTFKEVYFYNDESSLPSGAAIGDTAFYAPAAVHYQELTDDEVAAKPYMFLRIEDRRSQLYAGPVDKFRHRDEKPWGRVIQVYRLAETYLIAAEALMMLGNLGEAAEYFNVVRKRAEAPGYEIPLITPADLNIDEILDERARELFGEYRRWYDLKRTGTLLERVRAHNPDASPNIQEHHLLRPIPQDHIDRTTSDYPQNPGY